MHTVITNLRISPQGYFADLPDISRSIGICPTTGNVQIGSEAMFAGASILKFEYVQGIPLPAIVINYRGESNDEMFEVGHLSATLGYEDWLEKVNKLYHRS